MRNIKRKVIQIANSTQLISMPRKWAQKYGIKKGDELEVVENGNKLLIETEKGLMLEKAEIDITGLDRTTILFYIRSLYRNGYDEITVKFNEPYTIHLRTNEKKKVISVIHEVVGRLVGVEIIQQRENFCIIKNLSEISVKEFDIVLKRIFLLLLDVNNDLHEGVKNDNKILIETIEEKHDSVMKFVSYCLRILNKKGYDVPRKANIIHHIIADIDKLVDIMKESARRIILYNILLKKESKIFLETIHSSVILLNDIFYAFDIKKVRALYEIRDNVLKLIMKNIKILPKGDMIYICYLSSMFEIITDIADYRISLEY